MLKGGHLLRVLFVLPPDSSSTEAYYLLDHVLELTAALKKRDIEAFVLTPQKNERICSASADCSQVISWSGGNFEQELRGVIRQLRPDVLQIENRPDVVRSAGNCFTGQMVLRLHSLEHLSGQRITRRELRVALCMVDKVVTQSYHLKRLFLGRYYGLRLKTHVVHPGVNTDVFKPHAEHRQVVREHLGLIGRKVVMLALQQCLAQAQVELGVVLRAWPEVHRQTGAHLLVNGPKSLSLEEESPAVQNLGLLDRSEVIAIYRAADLLLLPNQTGDCPLTRGLEAMATGIPVVASMRGGLTELIDPTCGLLVRQYADSSTWGRVLSGLLAEDTIVQGLGDGAVKKTHSFTWDRAAAHILSVYGAG